MTAAEPLPIGCRPHQHLRNLLDEMASLHERPDRIKEGEGRRYGHYGIGKEKSMATAMILCVSRGIELHICLYVFPFPNLLGGFSMIWIRFVATKRPRIYCGFNKEMCKDTIVRGLDYTT